MTRKKPAKQTVPKPTVRTQPRKRRAASSNRSASGQGATHQQWLLQLTGIPTAAGREQRVIQWIETWVKARANLAIRSDRAGNLLISTRRAPAQHRPLIFQAHLDHPAFVVQRILDSRQVELEFRGGVADPYFESARIDIFDDSDRAHTARIIKLDSTSKPFKRVTAKLQRACDSIAVGDVARWGFRGRGETPEIVQGLLHTPACDDLAAVAAALSAFDVLRQQSGYAHVAVLFTRAEEIGFVGTLAACQDCTLPRDARIICLENSRSYAESPIGCGPILRVGDKMSVFDPRLTNRISLIMTEHARRDPSFKWQRKLMPGGTCEATVFSEYGFEATCLCLPLGNYHNQADIESVARGRRPARTRPEFISVADYHGLIEMLLLIAQQIDSADFVTMKQRVDRFLDELGFVLFSETNAHDAVSKPTPPNRDRRAAFSLY